jgi:catechol 2,3-dioxygenase-like lactoylglutathione lyase family enzyme
MALALDHLVILVGDLEQAIADYTDLGFTVQRGGTHADGNTHNALVGFADGSYLELIAFTREAPRHRWGAHGVAGRQGFVDFALWPQDAAATIAATRARGVAYEGPVAGGRIRPDGLHLEWQIGIAPSRDLPFLCGDVTPREWRVREGDVRFHANGVRGVAEIAVAVRDLNASLARYRALLGIQAEVETYPGVGSLRARLQLGPTSLMLVAPVAHGDERDGSALHEHLASRGEGLLGAVLQTNASITPQLLPLASTHDARLEIHRA